MREFRYLSTDPSSPVSREQTHSAPALLSAQIPEGSVLSHQDAVGNIESIFSFSDFFFFFTAASLAMQRVCAITSPMLLLLLLLLL